MRRAFILCLLLAACRNQETDEHLRKVEKELADLKAHPPAQTATVPAPPGPYRDTTPVQITTPDAGVYLNEPPVPEQLTITQAERLVGPNAAFVSTEGEKNLGFYCVFNRQVFLFKWNDETKAYHQIGVMADYRRLNVQIQISDALIEQMRDFLTRPPADAK